jgi:hypothetical protein
MTDEDWLREASPLSADSGSPGSAGAARDSAAATARAQSATAGGDAAAAAAACDGAPPEHHINSLPCSVLHGIFSHLGPRELCAVSATCAAWGALNRDKAANGVWRRFYTSRWAALGCGGGGPAGEEVCWQTKYGSKMKQVG